MFITNNSRYSLTLNGSPDGFSMKFKNGWTVSVQWHKDAYSHDDNTTAEIAAWDKDNNWFVFDRNAETVKGWQTPEEAAEFIKMISMLEMEE